MEEWGPGHEYEATRAQSGTTTSDAGTTHFSPM